MTKWQKLGRKKIQGLSEFQVNVSSSEIEACHCIGKSRNSSKKQTNKKKKQFYGLLIGNTPKKH